MIKIMFPHSRDCFDLECGKSWAKSHCMATFLIRGVGYSVLVPICQAGVATAEGCLIGLEIKTKSKDRFIFDDEATRLVWEWACWGGEVPPPLSSLELIGVLGGDSPKGVYLRRDVMALAAATWRDKNGKRLYAAGVRCHVCKFRMRRRLVGESGRQVIVQVRRGDRIKLVDDATVYVCSSRCSDKLRLSQEAINKKLEREIKIYRREKKKLDKINEIRIRTGKALKEHDLQALQSLLTELESPKIH